MNLKRLRHNWIYIVAFFLILILSLQTILLSSRLIGHNWDFTFPYPTDLFSRIIYFSKYTWLDYNLGQVPIFNLSHIIPNSMISLLGYALGSVTATKVLILAVFIIAFFGYKNLLDYLIKKHPIHYVFSLLFAFSPFLFNEIIGGSWYMWISYACAPYYMHATFRIVNDKKWRYIWQYLITSVFVISSLQNFTCVSVITLLYTLYTGYTNSAFAAYLKRYTTLHLILLAANSYWLISFGATFAEVSSHVLVSQKFAGGFNGVKTSLQSIINIMNLGGYLDRNMYLHALPVGYMQFFNIGFILAWLAIIYGLLFLNPKPDQHKKQLLFWFAIFLLSIFVVKGGNVPLSWLTMDLFNHFPLMRLFRSPQHLMFLPAMLVPILVAYTFAEYKKAGYRYITPFFIIVVLIWISGWFITGDIGKSTLASQKRDRIDLYELSPDLKQLYDADRIDPQYRRIIFLPSVASPIYKKTSYQSTAQGIIPEHIYLRNPTFTAEDTDFARIFERSFCDGRRFNYINYLSLFGVRNIVVRSDILPTFSDCTNRFNVEDVIAFLDREKQLKSVQSGEFLINYQIADKSRLLPLFIPRSITYAQTLPDQLSKLISQEGYRISDSFYLAEAPRKKDGVKNTVEEYANRPVIQYRKIHPAKYRIRVRGVRSPFPIVLSVNFHPLWKLYGVPSNTNDLYGNYVSGNINGTIQNDNLPSGQAYDVLFNKVVLTESDHHMINAYANSWIIDPAKICKITHCKTNSDGTFDLDLVIEFSLQRYYLIGTAISALFLVIIAGRHAYTKATKKKP